MLHVVARTADRRLAFSTWEEGRRLWDVLIDASPGVIAAVVMPDHVHVLVPTDTRERLGRALGGYTRWRNARRGERGTLWQRLPESVRVKPGDKARRSIRYVYLNPCRAGLVRDPLAWPLSTHLDAVGLAVDPVRRRVSDVLSFHAYVSGDPDSIVAGTDLPTGPQGVARPDSVLQAVSAATRTPMVALRRRGPSRQLAIRALRTMTPCSLREIASWTGCTSRTVARVRPGMDATLRIVERWVDDPRATPLDDGVLGHLLAGTHYRRWRR